MKRNNNIKTPRFDTDGRLSMIVSNNFLRPVQLLTILKILTNLKALNTEYPFASPGLKVS
jgi:hypothetical protein